MGIETSPDEIVTWAWSQIKVLSTIPAWEIVKWGWRQFKAWRRRHRRPVPRDVIEHRIRLRTEILEHLEETGRQGGNLEIIVRDVRRMDAFPDVDLYPVGISPWFKLDVNGLYHRGIEVFLSHARKAVAVVDEQGLSSGWRFLNKGEESDRAVTAWPLGRIPFDFIEKIDWMPDDYYGDPHFYCRFAGPFREPYETIVYKGKLFPDTSSHYFEMDGLQDERENWSALRRQCFLWMLPIQRHCARLLAKARGERTRV